MTVRRTVYITGIVVLCTWTLVPIYLIALSSVGGRAVVNNRPKPLLPPTDISLQTMREFLDIAGVWTSALYSVEAAVLCMAFSILLGVPAGYALARFTFAGATTYRLLILLTRAFPVAILALPLTVGFIRLGLYDTPFGVSLMHTTLALPFAVLVSASLFQAIPRELEEAAWVFGCSPTKAVVEAGADRGYVSVSVVPPSADGAARSSPCFGRTLYRHEGPRGLGRSDAMGAERYSAAGGQGGAGD